MDFISGKEADVKPEEVRISGTQGTTVQWLVSREKGSRSIALRRFVMRKGGHIPLHRHEYEEAFYVLKGRLSVCVISDGQVKKTEIGPGQFAYVDRMVPHSVKNAGDGEAEFICAINYPENMGIEIVKDDRC